MSKNRKRRNKKKANVLKRESNSRKETMGYGGNEYYNKYQYNGGYSNKKEFTVVCKETGEKIEMETYSETEFNKLAEHFEYIDGPKPIVMISKKDMRFKKTTKSVLTCAYDATEKYLESLLGRKLSYADKEWYKGLPMMVTSGLPAQYTFTVLNELVKPYGVGISHIYYSKKPLMNDDIAAWQKVLGVNPMGLITRDVSNQEYLMTAAGNEEGQLDPNIVKVLLPQIAEYNFEYTDDIPGPCIVFQDMANATYAGGGGHASYKGPREIVGTARIAIQYDYIEKCKWLCAPPELPDIDPIENWEIDFSECLTKSGVPWKDVRYKSTYTPSSNTPATTPPPDSSPKGFVPSVGRPNFTPVNPRWVNNTMLTEKEAREFIEGLGLYFDNFEEVDLKFDVALGEKAFEEVKSIITKNNGYSIYFEHGVGVFKKNVEEVLSSDGYLTQKSKKAIFDMLHELQKGWFADPCKVSVADIYMVYHSMVNHGSHLDWFSDVVAFTLLSDMCTLSTLGNKDENTEQSLPDDTVLILDTTSDFIKFAEEYYGTKWGENSFNLMYNPSTVKQLCDGIIDKLTNSDTIKMQLQGYPPDIQIPENHKYWFLWRSEVEKVTDPIIEKDDLSLAEVYLTNQALAKDSTAKAFTHLVSRTLTNKIVDTKDAKGQ